jgi:hypothetical protein
MENLELLLIGIANRQWEFSLRYSDNKFTMTIWKREWATESLAQSRVCPSFNGDLPIHAVTLAWNWIMGK